uniref:Uncharacterized protein n=1 Tax=Mucochytrium quahogii TaxID=96639 RepID=A0A7S2WAN7_9STRA|mmetsp:Transcript_7721/g.12489  ORF Transcript_7721/g.12489 Transcript_7721/m.12489 type:complete len:137 (+) Transcript_7721:145-555(+)
MADEAKEDAMETGPADGAAPKEEKKVEEGSHEAAVAAGEAPDLNDEDATRAAVAEVLGARPNADEGKKAEETASKGPDGSAQGNKKTLPIRAYLDQTIVPCLLAGLSQLAKERPDGNEVEWLAHWLLRNAPNKKKN